MFQIYSTHQYSSIVQGFCRFTKRNLESKTNYYIKRMEEIRRTQVRKNRKGQGIKDLGSRKPASEASGRRYTQLSAANLYKPILGGHLQNPTTVLSELKLPQREREQRQRSRTVDEESWTHQGNSATQTCTAFLLQVAVWLQWWDENRTE